MTTIAGVAGSCTDVNGTGTASAKFAGINGLALSGTTLYISTPNQIKQMDTTTYVVSSFAGNDTAGDLDGTGTGAQIAPLAMTKLNNDLYIIDSSQKIKKITISSGAITTIAGHAGVSETDNSEDGSGYSVSFQTSDLNSISNDGVENLFISELHKIRKINVNTGDVTTLLNSADQNEDIDSNQISTAKIYRPSGIVHTNKGLFITNYYGLRRLR